MENTKIIKQCQDCKTDFTFIYIQPQFCNICLDIKQKNELNEGFINNQCSFCSKKDLKCSIYKKSSEQLQLIDHKIQDDENVQNSKKFLEDTKYQDKALYICKDCQQMNDDQNEIISQSHSEDYEKPFSWMEQISELNQLYQQKEDKLIQKFQDEKLILLNQIKRLKEEQQRINSLSQRHLKEKNQLKNELFKYTQGYSDIEKQIISESYQFDSDILKDQSIQKNIVEMIFLAQGLQLLYRGSKNGFKSQDFRNLCGEKGSTLTLIRTKEEQKIIGAFTDIPWSTQVSEEFKYGEWKQGNHNSFLFKIENDQQVVKLNHRQDKCNETFHGNDFLPSFGNSLELYEDCQIMSNCSSNIGYYYTVPNQNIQYGSQIAKEFLAGQYTFMIDEIEVFQVIY